MDERRAALIAMIIENMEKDLKHVESKLENQHLKKEEVLNLVAEGGVYTKYLYMLRELETYD
ncbi:hypothetical protein [Sutcliffiella horikoshii]|uniref:hypothetical protein n=1 Tax=Sutcliffiella horikoshii TaxID=79883 RepID=UPI003CF0475D